MRICMITEEYPPETGWGGIGTYALDVARGHVAAGHHVDVITRTWEPPGTRVVDGVTVHRISMPEPSWRRGTRHATTRFWETRHVVTWARCAAAVAARLHAVQPFDVIESPEYHAQALACRLGNPRPLLAVRLHGPAALCRELNEASVGGSRADTWIAESLERRLTRRADVVTAPSAAMARYAARWGVDAAVIPNPFDATAFVEAGAAHEPGSRSLFFCGRVQKLKGIDTVIEALPHVLARFPDTVLSVAGADHPSGPGGVMMLGHLQKRAATLGVSHAITWLGQLSREALPAWYAQALIALVPSRWETFPYTCLEAMGTGRAVVASDAGGLPELVKHGRSGLTVPPGDADALATAINRLLDDPDEARRLGSAAQAQVTSQLQPTAISSRVTAVYSGQVAP